MKTINYRNEKEILYLLASTVRWGWLLATVTAGVLFALTLAVLREVGRGSITRTDYDIALFVAVAAWVVIYTAVIRGFRYGVKLLYTDPEDKRPKEEKYNKWDGAYPPLPHSPEWVQVLNKDGNYTYRLKSDVVGKGGHS
jgi:hypothetical protein